MPFVQRDQNNNIIALFADQQAEASEELKVDNQEIINFLKIPLLNNSDAEEQSQLLLQSDADFIRVLEDLISVLLDKHVFLLTDLPSAAQEKLLKRQKIRSDYVDFMGEEEDIF